MLTYYIIFGVYSLLCGVITDLIHSKPGFKWFWIGLILGIFGIIIAIIRRIDPIERSKRRENTYLKTVIKSQISTMKMMLKEIGDEKSKNSN